MSGHHRATMAVGAVLGLLATASSASAYPSQVSEDFSIGTVYGTCVVSVAARAEPGLAVTGRLTGTESVHCESLSVTPYWMSLSGGFAGTSLDVLNLTSSERDRVCDQQKACYWSRSKAWFPPGDYEVTHDVSIDLTADSSRTQYYSSVPAGCQVTAPDSGRVKCHFRQWVTVPAPAL